MEGMSAGTALRQHAHRLSLRVSRRVSRDRTIDFEGRSSEIADIACERGAIAPHPGIRFWKVEHPPGGNWPPILGEYSL